MMNSKTTNQPRKGDNMTISQHVSASPDFVQLEQSNKIFEHSKCSDSYDPLIAAYDFRWGLLFTKPLSQIEGMAIGVREDFLKNAHNRFRGGQPFAGNLCPDPASARVCFWSLVA
jgi:hypothetical protein